MYHRFLSLVFLVLGACNSVDLSTIMAGETKQCDDPDVVYVTVDPEENAASDTDVADSVCRRRS